MWLRLSPQSVAGYSTSLFCFPRRAPLVFADDLVRERRDATPEGEATMKLPRRKFLRLAAGAAAVPAVSRVAQPQAYPTQSAVVGSKRVVDSLNVRGSIPVLPCIHKQHTASIAWMLQARPAATPAHA